MLPLRNIEPDTSPDSSLRTAELPTIRWLRAVPSERPKLLGADGNPNERDPKPTEALKRLAEACRYSSRELARFLGISQRQLQRVFRSRLGCSPQAYLREERLQAAERLLHSASSVKEVAYALGFCQQSQFSRDFKERFGRRPSTLQRAARKGGSPTTEAITAPAT